MTNIPLLLDCRYEERSDEAIQLDRHDPLCGPRDDQGLKATGVWCETSVALSLSE